MNYEKYFKLKIPFKRKLDQIIKKEENPIIFDIGSCEGLDAIKYQQLYPNATIYAFEPIPSNIKILSKNLDRYNCPNILHFDYALSNKNGKNIMYVSNGNPPNKHNHSWDYGNKSSSLLKPGLTKEVNPWLKFDKTINVDTIRLDTFCSKYNIESIDYIHMDVQGAELDVLQGAGSLIDQIKLIWLEVENIELYRKQALKNDIEEFMEENGFKLLMSKMNKIAGDQLYINDTIAPNYSFWNKIFKNN